MYPIRDPKNKRQINLIFFFNGQVICHLVEIDVSMQGSGGDLRTLVSIITWDIYNKNGYVCTDTILC